MFSHLLLPTDGSDASDKAIRKALELAREGNARVTGLYVMQPFHLAAYKIEMVEESQATYEARALASARKYLEVIERGGKELGVRVDTSAVVAEHPYEAIIAAATSGGCDLIVMASHGRRGMKALLIGSETYKVLTHSTVPVLVLR
jgi:nucleotide-binding universal stress UspA family protein